MKKVSERKSLYADLSLFLVAAIWGRGYVFTINVLNYISPLYMSAFRFFISFISMFVIFFNRVKKTKLEDIKAGILVGFFLFMGYATQTYGIKYTTASKQ